jgi:hypothetical protein
MILITIILITMEAPGGGMGGAVDGAGDPVVGTIEEEVTEGEGVMGLMVVDLVVVVDLVEEVDLVVVVDLVEVVEAVVEVEEEAGVVVNHTSMIFLTYSQTLCTCQLTEFELFSLMRGPSDSLR